MKRFAIVGKNQAAVKRLKKRMQDLGFEWDKKKPQFMVCYGGDGTFLHAERHYPGVPKLLSRESSICQKCHNMLLGAVLERLVKGKYRIEEFNQLEVRAGRRKLRAVNDVIVRNDFPGHAIRFTVSVDGKQVNGTVIGDGIVAATVFGSTGYFRSIGGKSFKRGMGIAFNNPTKQLKPRVVSSKSEIEFKLVRGRAVVVADNNPSVVRMKDKGRVRIRQSNQVVRVITV